LNAFFAPYQASPTNAEIATPDYIYAANPQGETARPWETVTPLAAWLNYQQGTPQFNVSFSIDGGEPQLVQSVLSLSGVVLICWEHDNIMPNIMQAIDNAVPITNYASVPAACRASLSGATGVSNPSALRIRFGNVTTSNRLCEEQKRSKYCCARAARSRE